MILSQNKGRVGCAFCFSTLDNTDTNPSLQHFVKCSNCSAVFHASCYHSQGKCLRCNADTAIAFTLPLAPRLPVQKLHPLETHGTHLIVTEKGVIVENSRIKELLASIRIIAFALRSFLISVLFIIPITFIAAYTPTVVESATQTASLTPEIAISIILHSKEPDSNQFLVALFITFMAAYLVYPKKLYDYRGVISSTRRLVRLLAFVVGVVLVLLIAYDIRGSDILRNELQNRVDELVKLNNFEYAIVAISSFVLVIITGFLRRLLDPAPIVISKYPSSFRVLVNFFGKIRYYVVWLSLIIVITILTEGDILRVWQSEWISLQNLDNVQISITNWAVVAFISSLGVALLLYWPPNHSPINAHLGLFRLISLVICLAGLGWMYGLPFSTQPFLETCILAGSYTILLLPIQRALS